MKYSYIATSNATTLPSGDSNHIPQPVNRYYEYYWLDSWGGQHGLKQYTERKSQLKGIGAVYYSHNGHFHDFYRENPRNDRLKHNPTGSIRAHLLIYTVRANGEKEILLGLAQRRKVGGEHRQCPFLSLPYATPSKRGDYGKSVVPRALHFVTDRWNILDKGLRSHFIFQHSNVIYPVYVSAE